MHKQAVDKFPDTYASYETAILIDVFAAGPGRLREAIRDLSDVAFTSHPRPGKWSIKEIVPHVTDSEVQATWRIRMVLAQPGTVWPVFDQDIWSKAHAHQDLPVAELESALRVFAALRTATTPLLRRATVDDWRKHGVHPEFGPMTLRNLLELYADHSERHISQILLMRTMLGEPFDMPSILEPRLFE